VLRLRTQAQHWHDLPISKMPQIKSAIAHIMCMLAFAALIDSSGGKRLFAAAGSATSPFGSAGLQPNQ
jgi:hypothetical protein